MAYKYVGKGEYLPGVPARDLSDEEYAALPEELAPALERLYKKKVERKPPKEEVTNDANV